MVDYLRFTPELCYDWKQAVVDVERYYPHQMKRTLDASIPSQLESKLWIVDELKKIEDCFDFQPNIALIGGWFANYLTPLLIDNLNACKVVNHEIDNDAKDISYKYNKRYKETGQYQCLIKDAMMKELDEIFDIVINTSCEHMFPMKRFVEMNKQTLPFNGEQNNPLYVLQSTNDDQYDDHINCVSSPEELAEQAGIVPEYMGSLTLSSGMERFMVIGR
tara:strand:- start:10006 stop:10662 length:657 start_codon:yes stop_codon:yes gene_type:complete